jgi:hypothetical protein
MRSYRNFKNIWLEYQASCHPGYWSFVDKQILLFLSVFLSPLGLLCALCASAVSLTIRIPWP